jgi:heat shock protein HslJ
MLPDRSADGGLLRTEGWVRQPERLVAPALPLRACGNEPPWLATLNDDELVLVTDYGARRRAVPLLETLQDGAVTRYRAADGEISLVMTVQSRVCNDSMSGMPHPYSVELATAQGVLHGCGGEPVDLLAGREWEVARLDDRAPVTGSRITLRFFPEDGRVAGIASCNHFSAAFTLTGEQLRFSDAMSTMMACPGPLMAQEVEFLRLLSGVSAFGIDGSMMLELIGGEGRLVARPLPAEE